MPIMSHPAVSVRVCVCVCMCVCVCVCLDKTELDDISTDRKSLAGKEKRYDRSASITNAFQNNFSQ